MNRYLVVVFLLVSTISYADSESGEPVPKLLQAAGWWYSIQPRTVMCIQHFPEQKKLLNDAYTSFMTIRSHESYALEKVIEQWKGTEVLERMKQAIFEQQQLLIKFHVEQGLFTEEVCTKTHAKQLTDGYIDPQYFEVFKKLKAMHPLDRDGKNT